MILEAKMLIPPWVPKLTSDRDLLNAPTIEKSSKISTNSAAKKNKNLVVDQDFHDGSQKDYGVGWDEGWSEMKQNTSQSRSNKCSSSRSST